MRIFVVLPTYNEAENIGMVIDDIKREMPEAELLIIDDGSADNTTFVAEKTQNYHLRFFSI